MAISHTHHLDEPVLRLARRLSLEAESDSRLCGRFELPRLRAVFAEEHGIRLPRSPSDGPMGRLIESGAIVQYPTRERIDGRLINVYRAPGVDGIDLGTLMKLAQSCVDSELKGERGRKGQGLDVRQVDRLSTGQFAKIRTMARQIAFYVAPGRPEEEAYAKVGRSYLAWDPGASVDGDWRPMLDLVRASGPPPTRLADDIGAARRLLDLAATHGLLLRTPLARSYVIPTSWAPLQQEWIDVARGPGISANLGVAYFIGAIVQTLGTEVDPRRLSTEQVESVLDALEISMKADSTLNTGRRSSIRRSIRRLMEGGLIPSCHVRGHGFRTTEVRTAWDAGLSERISEVVGTNVRESLDRSSSGSPVGPEVSLKDLPGYAIWKDFPFPTLGDPDHPYSIARVLDFHTVKGRERTRRGFRALGTFPREEPRGRSSLSGRPWSSATVRIHLTNLARYVACLMKYGEVNPKTASLADLITPENLEIFVDAVLENEWTTVSNAQRVLVTLGLIASPCLEDMALSAGDIEQAKRFYAASCLATGKGKQETRPGGTSGEDGLGWNGRPLFIQLQEEREENRSSIETQKEEAKKVERAFRTVLKVRWAYDGMNKLFDAARATVLNRIGGVRSTGELLAELAHLDLRTTDLEHLRSLMIYNLGLAAPLRTRTYQELTPAMLVFESTRTVRLEVPAKSTKVPENGDYHVLL